MHGRHDLLKHCRSHVTDCPISDCKLEPGAHATTSVTSKLFTPATIPYSSEAFTSNAAADEYSSGRDSALTGIETPLVKDPIFRELMKTE